MRIAIKLLTIAAFAILFTGCKKDDPVIPAITITNSNYTVGAMQNLEAKAVFSINAYWTTTISYESTSKDWLTVTPTSGKAGQNIELTMTAAPNTTTEAERVAYVTINYAGKTHKITITQADEDITSHFDPKFAAELEKRLYIPNAKKIMLANVKTITYIDVSGTQASIGELTSLSGIEYFAALKILNCGYNQLSAPDVSKNTALEILYCTNNQLNTLDVSKNTALTYLSCYNNQLSALNISKNTALTYLSCYNNLLSALDVSKNTVLAYLYCSGNLLTALDVSKNTALSELWCENNQLSVLDVSKSTALSYLHCNNNQLSVLDVSKNAALIKLWCYDNQLTVLDVSKNTALTTLLCRGNQLSALDVSNNAALSLLWCYSNKLSMLDVSKNTALMMLDCSNNPGASNVFIVKAWFDNGNIPSGFTNSGWPYNGYPITINYQKVN